MARIVSLAILLLVTATVGVASAQSFNVDFGEPADAPTSTYAAAGLPGVWNSIQGEDSPMTVYSLVGLDGMPTGVTLYNIGGTDLLSASDPSVSGDAARLLNDALITYTSSLETCLFVDGLMPGTYEVTMYAWMPNAPGVRSRVRHDLSGTTVDVGGAWTGAHVEGVTYARHTLVIPSDGALRSHSGIVPGMPESAGAALNGFQLRLVDCPTCPDAGPPPPTDAGTAVDAGSAFDAGAALDAGATTDAGTTVDAAPPSDGGAMHMDAGATTDASPRVDAGPSTSSSGCGCHVGTGSRSVPTTGMAAAGTFLTIVVRRRGRRSETERRSATRAAAT